MTGYSYFGLLDDVLEQYPFDFKLNSKRLKFELSTQLIDGKPLILNDGYLVLHPVCSKSIQDMDGLIWHLITRGFITVLHRGGKDYRLDEMPEVMANKNIKSYQNLVTDKIPGFIKWQEYKKILSHIHDILEGTNGYQSWPPYKSESGFVALSKQLLENQITLHNASMNGIGVCWSKNAIIDFLQEFTETFDPRVSGPRNYWEHLAKTYSRKKTVTIRPKAFLRGMMGLSNELYHYNFGIMLSAHQKTPISVETRNSNCFRFLLSEREYIAEEAIKIPKLNVPLAVLTAPDIEIAKIYDNYRNVGKLRQEWLNIKSNYTGDGDWDEVARVALEYSQEISTLLGGKINFGFKENLFGYTLGKITGEYRREASVTLGGAIAGSLFGPAGTVAGMISGYIFARSQKHAIGKITDLFKIRILNKKLTMHIKNIDKISSSTNISASCTLNPKIVKQLITEYEPV